MKRNHLNLVVPDRDAAQELFVDIFGFMVLLRRGDALAVLTGEDGFTLVLADSRRFGGDGAPRYPETFHIGFLQETREAVDALYARRTTAPVELGHAPRMLHGSYGCYRTALGGSPSRSAPGSVPGTGRGSKPVPSPPPCPLPRSARSDPRDDRRVSGRTVTRRSLAAAFPITPRIA